MGAADSPVGPPATRPQARAFDAAYTTTPNWDIGRPQKSFVYLEESGRIGARFAVWDAMRLADLGILFDSVVDSAMFHCLGDAERDRMVEGLASVLRPGGSYFLLADARPDDSSLYDGGVSRRELRERFSDGWRIDFVLDTVFERRWSRNAALFAGIRRVG